MKSTNTRKVQRPKNPREGASIFSRFTFFYFYRIVKDCCKKDFCEEDIYQPLSEFQSRRLGDEFEKIWSASVRNWKKRDNVFLIISVLFKQFYKIFLPKYFLFCVIKLPLSYIQPVLIGKIVAYFKKDRTQSNDIYYYGAGLIISNIIIIFSMQHYIQAIYETSLQLSITLSSVIYRKTLKINPLFSSKITHDTSHLGNSVTLITKDVFNFLVPLAIISEGMIMVIIVLVQIFNIVAKVGDIGLIVLGVFILEITIEIILGAVVKNKRLKASFYTAGRIFSLKEAFSMMRAIKFNAWERFFIKRIEKYRKDEIRYLRSIFHLRIGSFIIGNIGTSTAFVATTFFYIWVNGTISAELLYFLMTSIDTMKYFFSVLVPNGVSRSGELVASLRRIQNFLLLEESCPVMPSVRDNPKIVATNFNVVIDDKILKENINVEVNKKGLVVVSGSISSGKSVFLKSILGEIQSDRGLQVEGSLSYASQDPWLFPGSIKQNILFGQSYQVQRYEEVISSCALTLDFSNFKEGDESLIIDDGFNLSAGQQRRINLARAIYQDKQIYLLDSVFCNIDAKTNRFIFERVVKHLLKDKIIILISNDPYHIKNADKVIYFNQQQHELHKEFLSEPLSCENDYECTTQNEENEDNLFYETSPLVYNFNNQPKINIYKEKIQREKVLLKTFKTYINYCGGFWMASLVLALFAAFQFFSSSSQKAISIWINKEGILSDIKSNLTINQMKSDLYFKTMEARNSWFLAFMISFSLGTVFIILATFSLFFITSRASKKIHTSMTTLTITTKMDFFCSNLMGVILNRFSKDVNNLDEDLPFNLYLAISLFLEVLGICALIISSNWIFLIPILIIVFAGFLFMKFVLFLVIAKVKRLESALHSPMVGYLTSTIKGLSTIRVLKTNDQQLVNQFDQYQDLFATASFIIFCSIQLLKYCIYILSNLFVIVILVYFISTGDATPGDVGIGIGKSMAMFRYIRKLLNIVMELEADMTSMERITDYLNLKSENNSGYELAETWPETGAITLKNVNLIYSSTNEHVLKNIDLKINSREKVVLIGRTGSGKSSLISCLFRLFDYSGSIIIDDINIKGLELNYLRSRFGIVSQETAVFAGTLRQNLDPFNQYSDEDIFRVTHKIRYFCSNSKSILSLRNLPLNTLNEKLKDLTPSEMLLVSFMRIMLTKKRIIILDEVASNLDESTIEIIDQLIEEYFQNQTVITIAHRLKNIKNMDKICVLAAGKILEFGTYEDLMNNPKSELCKMIHKTSNFSK